MNTRLKLIISCLLVLAVVQKSFSKLPSHRIYLKHCITNVIVGYKTTDSAGVVVGSKTSDSTATATIADTEIQQSIVSTISFLNNTTISNDAPFILVGKEYSYLIFKTASATSASIRVAVELTLVGEVYKFQNSTPGKQIHICEVKGECPTCDFLKDTDKTITGCGCNSGDVTDNGGCQQFFFFTH